MSGGRHADVGRLWLQLWRNLGVSERRRLKVAVASMVVGSFATALTPYIVGLFVNSVLRRGRVVGLGHAYAPLGLLAAVLLVVSGMTVIQHQQIHYVTTAFTADMRNRIYASLLRWDIARFVDDAKGAIYGRANRSIEGAERLIKLGAGDLLPAVLVTVFGTALAFVRFGLLGFVMVAVVPTGFAIVRWQVRSQSGIRVQVNQAKERIDGDVSAWLNGIEVTRSLGAEPYLDSRVSVRTDQLRRKELSHHIAMSLFDCTKAANESFWLILTLGTALAFRRIATPGDLSAAVLLYLAITRPLRELHRVIDQGSEAALQTRNLHDDLSVPRDPSYERRVPPPDHSGVSNKAIEFEDVTFSYPSVDQPTLRGLTATIWAGERVGLVGASGCGKSTLLKLVVRLIHGHQGSIRLNGLPIECMDRTRLVETLGYVGQKPVLFQGTIRENLTLGRSTVCDEELVRACIRANVHADILSMPNGYDSVIGEEGARLSGGQSQRLCLARALVRTPPVLILDEPTSALDGPSQAVIQQAIDDLSEVTMLVVAHRLSTLRTMDRILVLDHGRVVEEGSYEALSRSGKVFSKMLSAEAHAA